MTAERLWEPGRALIVQGDARRLPVASNSVAACVTSPPYNVGIAYDTVDDLLPWCDYEKLASEACTEINRVLVSGGRAWINVVPAVPDGRDRRSLVQLWSSALLDSGLLIRDYVVWSTAGRGGPTAWGSWQSPAAPNLRGEWETIIVAYKSRWTREAPQSLCSWRDQIGDWPALVSNVWRIKPERRNTAGHPAPFPDALARRAIRLSTWPGELVIDPFSGQGATVRAAVDLGRDVIGIDLSARYCGMARQSMFQGVLFGSA